VNWSYSISEAFFMMGGTIDDNDIRG
jgi:hypothetical protein